MPKTKITLEEIEYMLRFGREMAKRMETLGIQPTAVSRLTDGRVSSSYISDIRRAALGLSRRFSRLGREKVLAIADALQWPELEALESAGYLTKENPSPIMTLSEVAHQQTAAHAKLEAGQRIVAMLPHFDSLSFSKKRLLLDELGVQVAVNHPDWRVSLLHFCA